eukprot:TRINITY_DN6021_c0_g1_i2.p3 TRINITY_DN6021_c0_g1~~TRINITY_DN6021_c0_g1_i2.p3  ORF type:complete len:228 (+),score=41.56 TRINITY_DN6021_c0_g1_i2:87-770(+)
MPFAKIFMSQNQLLRKHLSLSVCRQGAQPKCVGGQITKCGCLNPAQIPKVVQVEKSEAKKEEQQKGDENGLVEKEELEDELSKEYTHAMQQQMGSGLVYDHSKGINYTLILPDLIVGSCLNSIQDVDTLKSIGVTTILCLQEDTDMDYFGIEIDPIVERCKELGIYHIREPIHDFDAFDVRKRLPAIIKKLRALHDEKRGDKLYIHCTAGMGRAPSVAAMYMTWIRG